MSTYTEARDRLAERGITGDDAHTSLQTFLDRARTALDGELLTVGGNLRRLTTVGAVLRRRYGAMTVAERANQMAKAYGADAARTAAVLMEV